MSKRVDWVKFDHNFPERDDIESLTGGAFRAFVHAICLADRLNTDGELSKIKVASIAKPTVRRELVAAGHWIERENGGISIKKYLEWQRSAEQKRAAREGNARRQRQHRAAHEADEAGQDGTNVKRDITRYVTRDNETTTGTELEAESELELEVEGLRAVKGSSTALPFEQEIALTKLRNLVGDDGDHGTTDVLRYEARGLPPGRIFKVCESLERSSPYNRAGFAVNALKSERAEHEKRALAATRPNSNGPDDDIPF